MILFLFFINFPLILKIYRIFDGMNKNITANAAIEKFLLRINKDVKSQAEVKAKEQNRSLNGHIVNLIKQDLEAVKPA